MPQQIMRTGEAVKREKKIVVYMQEYILIRSSVPSVSQHAGTREGGTR